MSGLLHPVGPQPPATYWVRRGGVVLVLVVVIVVLVAAIRAIAAPDPAPTTAVPAGSEPGPLAPTPTGDPSSRSSTPAASPSVSPSTSVTPSKTSSSAAPVDCAASDLVGKLRGAGRVRAGKPITYAIAVANSSKQTCGLTIDPASVELRIYSGTDRIWSTKDCPTLVPKVHRQAGAGRGIGASIGWNGKRSAAGCRTRPETPRPGTYYTTLVVTGADPVQQRLIIS